MPDTHTAFPNHPRFQFQDTVRLLVIRQGLASGHVFEQSHNPHFAIQIYNVYREAHEKGVHALTGCDQHTVALWQGFVRQ